MLAAHSDICQETKYSFYHMRIHSCHLLQPPWGWLLGKERQERGEGLRKTPAALELSTEVGALDFKPRVKSKPIEVCMG